MRYTEQAPVAVYHTTKQICVGIFRSVPICDKYLFGQLKRTMLLVRNKNKNRTNLLNVSLAFRNATQEQIAFLADRDYWVHDDYKLVEGDLRVRLHARKVCGDTSPGAPHRIPPNETKEKIKDAYISGEAAAAIAKKYDVSTNYVRSVGNSVKDERIVRLLPYEILVAEINRRSANQ